MTIGAVWDNIWDEAIWDNPIWAQVAAELKLVSDTGIGVDLMPGLTSALGVIDLATATDGPPLFSAEVIATDSGAGTELLSTLQTVLKSIVEAAVGVDASTHTVSCSISDAGTAVESAVLSAYNIALDSGLATDELSKLEQLLKAVSEAASGQDEVLVQVQLVTQDGAVATEASALASLLIALDTAGAADMVVRRIDGVQRVATILVAIKSAATIVAIESATTTVAIT